ncbi:protein kinase [bacterium]|nr:protein kinase [bacterium]
MSKTSHSTAPTSQSDAAAERASPPIDHGFLLRPVAVEFHRLWQKSNASGQPRPDIFAFVRSQNEITGPQCRDVCLVDQFHRWKSEMGLPAETYCRLLRNFCGDKSQDLELELVLHELSLRRAAAASPEAISVDDFCARFPGFRPHLLRCFADADLEATRALDQTRPPDEMSQTFSVAATQPRTGVVPQIDLDATTLEMSEVDDGSSLTLVSDHFQHNASSLLGNCGPFSKLPPILLQEIESNLENVVYEPGEYLTREGDPGDGLFVIQSGEVEIRARSESGEPRVLATSGSGEILGEMALLTEAPRTADLIAVGSVSVKFLPVAVFENLAGKYPVISRVLTQLLAERLGQRGHDALAGKTLDRFRIVRRLGKGGMAIVYAAEHLDTELPVALKMMSHRLVYDLNALKLFQREARIIEGFDHPNIVRMLGRFKAFRSFFIVMEYCDGTPLDKVVRKSGPLSAEQFCLVFRQLCDALAYAHDQNVVHRDIKPSNVMLTEEGTVKLMDFGLANPLDTNDESQSGVIAGTPRYMAPEQLRGDDVDTRADLFSLGCTAWKLLTGSDLVTQRSLVGIEKCHTNWQVPTFKNVPGNVATFLQTCLTFDREDREVDLRSFPG